MKRVQLEREQRDFHVTPVEVRDGAEGSLTFSGVASVVDTPYEVTDMFGSFTETMRAGAFKRTLNNSDDIRLLVNHEGVPIARTKSGTLQLSTDPNLRVTAKLDVANPTVQELRSAMKRGDIDQMSIGMRIPKGGDEWNKTGTERTIHEAKLSDVSVVTYPASMSTTASLRSQLKSIEPLLAELRAGRMLSAANVALLTSVLSELATADTALEPLRSMIDETDEALDSAQQALADVLGVANPDTDDAAEVSEDVNEAGRSAAAAKRLRLWDLRVTA